MNKVVKYLSFLGLALVLVPAVLYLFAMLEKSTMSLLMIAGTVLWFSTVPFWSGRRQ